MPYKAPTHKPARPAKRDTRRPPQERGYDAHWRYRLQPAYLRAHPMCSASGCTQPATCVDHVRPLADGGTNDDENLQSLCHSCHSRKTVRSDGGFGRPRSNG